MSVLVAPREGRVSRNLTTPRKRCRIEIVAPREGRVSRNELLAGLSAGILVAPREGRVSRNQYSPLCFA